MPSITLTLRGHITSRVLMAATGRRDGSCVAAPTPGSMGVKHGGAAGRIRIPAWNPCLVAMTPARRGQRLLPRGGRRAEAAMCNLDNLNYSQFRI